jgi:hypothetical protein
MARVRRKLKTARMEDFIGSQTWTGVDVFASWRQRGGKDSGEGSFSGTFGGSGTSKKLLPEGAWPGIAFVRVLCKQHYLHAITFDP